MTRIGVISDTHGYLHAKMFKHFEDCDEIWHAGDIGSVSVAERLSKLKPFRAVHGNIDGYDVRAYYPEVQRFMCEDVDVMMKHIGGYPGRYDISIRERLYRNPPKIFISGHSHILKIIYDKKLQCLHINPGAAGKSGVHHVITMVKFIIDGQEIKDMKIIELER